MGDGNFAIHSYETDTLTILQIKNQAQMNSNFIISMGLSQTYDMFEYYLVNISMQNYVCMCSIFSKKVLKFYNFLWWIREITLCRTQSTNVGRWGNFSEYIIFFDLISSWYLGKLFRLEWPYFFLPKFIFHGSFWSWIYN